MERIRVRSAPVVALIGSALAAWCTVTTMAVLRQLGGLAGLTPRFVGWLGLGLSVTVASALLAVLAARWCGSGPALALGSLACCAGLLTSDDLTRASQLGSATVVLGVAAGLLWGGVASMAFELPVESARATMAGWITPAVVGGAVQAWALSDDSSDRLALTASVSAGWLVPLSAVVAGWGIGTLLLVVRPARGAWDGWREAWWSLALAQVVLFAVVMMIGFDARLRLYWLRPVVLVTCSLALAVWLLVSMLLPAAHAKIAFLSVSFVSAAVPPVLQFVFAVGDPTREGLGAASLIVVLVAVAAGACVAFVRPRQAVIGGLVGVVLGAGAAWPVTGHGAAWFVSVALLVGAGVAVAVGGMLVALESVAATQLVAFAAVSALVLGGGIAIPLGWALVGDLAVGPDDVEATSRVLAGLVFSLAALLAAYTSILARRIDRRLRSAGAVPVPSAAAAFRGVGAVGGQPEPEGRPS